MRDKKNAKSNTTTNNVKKGSVKKISRKGIRARMDDEGEDDQQGSMQQGFVPTPKTSAGAAEINMMKQSARSLIPQLLDLTAALSALPSEVYVENSGTEASVLLLQARLLVARAVEHVEKLSEIAKETVDIEGIGYYSIGEYKKNQHFYNELFKFI